MPLCVGILHGIKYYNQLCGRAQLGHRIQTRGNRVHTVYDALYHGFAIRFKNPEQNEEIAEEIVSITMEYFDTIH